MNNLDNVFKETGLLDLVEKISTKEISITDAVNDIKQLCIKYAEKKVVLDNINIAHLLQGVAKDLTSGYDFDTLALLKTINKAKNLLEDYHNQNIELKNSIELGLSNNSSFTPNTWTFNKHSLLNGFIYNGLTIIGGESSAGKSTFTLELCIDYLATKSTPKDTVLIIWSLDDSISKTYIKLKKIASNQNLSDWVDTNVYLLDSFKYGNFGAMRNIIRKLQKENKEVICILDYLQLIKFPDKEKIKPYIDNTVYEIKQITNDFNIMFFLLSQLNRDKIGKYNYRESSEIENQAEICINISVQDPLENDTRRFRGIKHLKNKEFDCGQLFITYIQNNRFDYLPLERGKIIHKGANKGKIDFDNSMFGV